MTQLEPTTLVAQTLDLAPAIRIENPLIREHETCRCSVVPIHLEEQNFSSSESLRAGFDNRTMAEAGAESIRSGGGLAA